MQLTITINDPETILKLQRYRQFLAEEDVVDGSMDQIAEGMMLGHMGDHDRFLDWCVSNAQPAPLGPMALVAVPASANDSLPIDPRSVVSR